MPCDGSPASEELLVRLGADSTLDAAFVWLCRQRRDHGPNSGVRDMRRNWATIKPRLQQQLAEGDYIIGPTITFLDKTGEYREMREAEDVLVLRALAQTIASFLYHDILSVCTHVAGHGGCKRALREALVHLPTNPFVIKTDIRRYYASIDHFILHGQMADQINDKAVLRLIWQAIRRTTWDDGVYREHTKGIALGCPLSPLLGAVYLASVDTDMERHAAFYVRFMDDLLILAPTRHKLRDAMKRLHGHVERLALELYPEKTFIGRWRKGLVFLGLQIEESSAAVDECPDAVDTQDVAQEINQAELDRPPRFFARVTKSPALKLRLSPSAQAWSRFHDRCRQLYEQGAEDSALEGYGRRWLAWLRSGLDIFLVATTAPLRS